MTFHNRPLAVCAATVALLGSAGFYTKDAGDPLDVLAKKFGDYASETLTKLGATNEDLDGLKARLDEMEQKAARSTHWGTPAEPDTIGKQFSEYDAVKSFAESQQRGRVSLNIKSTISTASNSAGGLTEPLRDGLLGLPKRRLTIRNLMPVINVSTGTVEYPRLTARPSAADVVAEMSVKPESAMTFDLVSTGMRVIAHWIPASRQILDDAPQLRGIIDSELLYGLKLKEETQLLYGSGTGQNLLGMVTQATAYASPITGFSNPTMIDMVGLSTLR